MTKRISPILLLLLLVGCSNYNCGFSPDASGPKGESPLDHREEGFFILRYLAYQGNHRLGGTLNEIAIRNISDENLVVEAISLNQKFRGENVTDVSAPIHYIGGDVFSGTTTQSSVIGKGQWMYFVFPTKDIRDFAVGDKMNLEFSISLRSGAKRYANNLTFTKTIIKYPWQWP